MKNVIGYIKGRGKIVIISIVVIIVLISIFVFNGLQKNNFAIVYAENGTYIEASGTVERNSVLVSSEVIGVIDESKLREGDSVKKGDIIAKINSTNIQNQYDQALINFRIYEKNIDLIETSINSLSEQNANAVKQALNAYLATEAEYNKVMDGASHDEIRQAEEAVNQAKINLDYMKINLERSQKLLEQQVISQSKYDEVLKSCNVGEVQYNTAVLQLNLIKSYPTEDTANAAKSKMQQAKAGYEFAISNGNTQLQQLESQLEIAKVELEQAKNIVEQTKRELEKLIIKSPIDGIVNSMFINEGEFVTTGKLAAEIYYPNNIEIKAYVSEANIGYIKVGQDVKIFADSHENRSFKGKVIKINNQAEFTPKNIQTKEERVNTVFKVTVEVLDSQDVIKPGMPVDLNIKID